MAEKTRWYDSTNGEIVTESLLKKPTKDGRSTTPTTKKHAREFGYLPSVTSIISTRHSYQLEKYKIEGAVRACIDNPFAAEPTDEAIDKYMNFVIAKSGEYAKKAADRGTQIHAGVQRFLTGIALPEPLDPVTEQIAHEINKYIISQGDVLSIMCEKSLFSKEVGAAGTPDIYVVYMDGNTMVVDLKSVDFDKWKEPYVSWKLQLGGYRALLMDDGAKLVQAVCDREGKGPTKFIRHEGEAGWQRAFMGLLTTWIVAEDYDPRS